MAEYDHGVKVLKLYSRKEPRADLRRCGDCASVKGAISFWCTSPERDSRDLEYSNCDNWTPMPMASEVPWWRWFLGEGLLGGFIVLGDH